MYKRTIQDSTNRRLIHVQGTACEQAVPWTWTKAHPTTHLFVLSVENTNINERQMVLQKTLYYCRSSYCNFVSQTANIYWKVLKTDTTARPGRNCTAYTIRNTPFILGRTTWVRWLVGAFNIEWTTWVRWLVGAFNLEWNTLGPAVNRRCITHTIRIKSSILGRTTWVRWLVGAFTLEWTT